MLNEGLEIELTDFEEENPMLQEDLLRQVVEIELGGVPIILGVHFIRVFMCFGRILLEGSMEMNLFDPMILGRSSDG